MTPEPYIQWVTYQETWPIRHKAMWPNKPLEYVMLPEDREGRHFGCFINTKLVGVISIFMKGDSAQFRKFATLPDHQGAGHGSLLLAHTLDYLEDQGMKRIWCNARMDKQAFYRKFGFLATGKSFVKGGISFSIMEKHP